MRLPPDHLLFRLLQVVPLGGAAAGPVSYTHLDVYKRQEENRPKIKRTAAKHFEGLTALSTHSAGRRAAVKAGCKPVHFSLDGCPLSCYFFGSVATSSGHFVPKSGVGREAGLSYTPCLLMKPFLRLRLYAPQAQPCFPAASNAIALPGGNGI